jgi:hypothetical protein
MLLKGDKFLKFGRSGFFGGGSPHWKFVYCDCALDLRATRMR